MTINVHADVIGSLLRPRYLSEAGAAQAGTGRGGRPPGLVTAGAKAPAAAAPGQVARWCRGG